MKELDLHPAGSRKGNIKGARPPASFPPHPPYQRLLFSPPC
jgi:hypothetical protein